MVSVFGLFLSFAGNNGGHKSLGSRGSSLAARSERRVHKSKRDSQISRLGHLPSSLSLHADGENHLVNPAFGFHDFLP